MLYPEKFQDLESQVLNRAIIVRLGDMGLQKNVTFQNLGHCQALRENAGFQICGGCQVLTIMFTCVHVMEDQVMQDIILTWV